MPIGMLPSQLKNCHLTRLYKLEKGTRVYSQGDVATEFYYVNNGLVGLYHVLENGKESLLRLYSAGEYFGFRTLFGGHTYHCSARVLVSSELTRIFPTNMPLFIQHNTEAVQALLYQLACELQESEHRLVKMSYLRSFERVVESIRYLTEHYPDYPWTYREIAEYSGCETETAIRISKELKRQGILLANDRHASINREP